MNPVLSALRGCTSPVHRRLIAALFILLLFPSAPSAAADQSAIAQLNRQVAVVLRTPVGPVHPSAPVRSYSFELGPVPARDAAGPLGRRFTLPAWAATLAQANRLLYVHSGGFEFDGWNALAPRGVARLKFTVRL